MVESVSRQAGIADARANTTSNPALAPKTRVGQITPVQHVNLLGVHGLQLDELDAHRRWFGFDDERDDEVLFPIARRHRRPLRHQQLLGA